jgi:quinol monooxygenase YgiN
MMETYQPRSLQMDPAVTPDSAPAAAATSAIVELRQYTLHPGRRDELMALFEKRFVAGQEAHGMHLHGEFRDAANPDRFAWLRGFDDMSRRARALDAFYRGPVWKAHSAAANAAMVDTDNVLLLQPAEKGGFSLARRMTATMVATIYLLQSPVDDAFLRFFGERVRPVMEEAGAPPVAQLRTLDAPNNFPALPVREGEHAFVWFAAFASGEEYRRHLDRLKRSERWGMVEKELAARLKASPVRLELQPTAESLQRNAPAYDYSTQLTGSRQDFDFIAGTWSLSNRRLKARGAGSHDWDSFPARSTGMLLLGGLVNVDEIVFPTKSWSGVTFRTFDVEKKQWSIYWVNSRDGRMQEPVVGGFSGDTGLFFGEDLDEGRPVKVVYRWTRHGPDAARWEQAFSYDGGKTWETNWVNDLTRESR